jgi:hypothetical protein
MLDRQPDINHEGRMETVIFERYEGNRCIDLYGNKGLNERWTKGKIWLLAHCDREI